MPDNKPISQLITAEQTGASDLYELAIPNAMTETGYISRKVSASELANLIVSRLQYQGLNTDAKTIISAINEVRAAAGGGSTMVGGQLTAGQTSITLTDSSIDSSKLFDIYAPWGISPTSEPVIDDINHTITIEFEAQATNIDVAVEVKTNGSV